MANLEQKQESTDLNSQVEQGLNEIASDTSLNATMDALNLGKSTEALESINETKSIIESTLKEVNDLEKKNQEMFTAFFPLEDFNKELNRMLKEIESMTNALGNFDLKNKDIKKIIEKSLEYRNFALNVKNELPKIKEQMDRYQDSNTIRELKAENQKLKDNLKKYQDAELQEQLKKEEEQRVIQIINESTGTLRDVPSLSLEQATLLVDKANTEDWITIGISSNSFEEIDVSVAEKLAEFKGDSLMLANLKRIDVSVAEKLAEFKGDLMLGNLKRIDVSVAEKLAEFKGYDLYMDSLEEIDEESVKALLNTDKKFTITLNKDIQIDGTVSKMLKDSNRVIFGK